MFHIHEIESVKMSKKFYNYTICLDDKKCGEKTHQLLKLIGTKIKKLQMNKISERIWYWLETIITKF